jgi:hypothetical protein
MIKIVQGFNLRYAVKTAESQLVIRGDGIKYVITDIEEADGRFYLIADRDTTKEWLVGEYKYQILNAEGIEDEGEFYVMCNFALSDAEESIKSVNEKYLEAIEAQIAGKATKAQQSMSVGDKSISYCTIDELLKLKDYYTNKVKTEQGKYTAGNAGKIKYKWNFR